MHLKSDNIEFMFYDNVNEVVNELFELLLSRYEIGLEKCLRRSDLVLIDFSCCIINVTRNILNVVVHMLILQTG